MQGSFFFLKIQRIEMHFVKGKESEFALKLVLSFFFCFGCAGSSLRHARSLLLCAGSSLWHSESLVVACGLLVAACMQDLVP